MHYYKKNIGDYAKKTGRLSMLQHGAYTLLIDCCYDRERFPTIDEAIEWTWASSESEIEAVQFVLKRFFTFNDGRYIQTRIQEEISEYHAKASINKRIAEDREAKRKANSTDSERSVNDSSPSVNKAPPNHKPITNNQQPLLDLDANASLPEDELPTCPHREILQLYKKHLPHLTQPRVWEGNRMTVLKSRWIQASKPSNYSPKGYKTREDGLKWWDSFFAYIANDSSLNNGFKSKDRTWLPDLEWIITASNFAKIIDGKYAK